MKGRVWTLKDGIQLDIIGPVDSFAMGTNGLKPPFYRCGLKSHEGELKTVFCETRKGLMGLVRLEVAKFRNPQLHGVIKKLEGKMDFTDMLKDWLPHDLLKQQLMVGNSLLAKVPKGTQFQGRHMIVPFQAGSGKAGAIQYHKQAIQAQANMLAKMQMQLGEPKLMVPRPEMHGLLAQLDGGGLNDTPKVEKPKKKNKWKFWGK